MDSATFGELAALGTAVLWTLSALAWTSAGKRVGALPVAFIRLLVTCVFLAVSCRLSRDCWYPNGASAETWLLLGLSGLVGFFLADICAFEAFLLIGPRLTLLLQSLTPPVAALISWLALGEALHAKHWLAMAVTLVGVVWVVLERPDAEAGPRSPRTLRLGVFLAAVSAIALAIGMVLSKQGVRGYDEVAATFIRVLGGIAGFAVLTTAAWRWRAVLGSVAHGRAMVVILFGSLVGPFLGVVLSLVALNHCEAGIVTTILSITPVLILPFAVLVHRERVSLRATLGAFVSVAGVVLFFV